MEALLRALLTASIMLLLGCSASSAQLALPSPNSPAIGATSPLGIPGTTSPVGPVGIPFGATSLSPSGLSPAPFDPTASNSSCSSATPSGLSSGAMDSLASCGVAPTTGTASGTSSSGVGTSVG